jgi:peptidoglycan LD-endopeptidase LytH
MPRRYALPLVAAVAFLTGCAPQAVVKEDRRTAPRPAPPRAEAPQIVYESPARTPEPEPEPEVTYAPARPLVMPVEGFSPSRLRDTYTAPRSGGRTHHAIDIGAPTGTRLFAVTDGRILRMTNGGLGGIALTLQSDDGLLLYYYAHLSRYADGLREGQRVQAGDLVGYVGTTGNATVPHLHFAVWYAGRNGYRTGNAINPYPLLARGVLPPRATPGPARTAPVETPRRPAVTVTRVPGTSDAEATPRMQEEGPTRRPAVSVTRVPASSRTTRERPSTGRRPAVTVTRTGETGKKEGSGWPSRPAGASGPSVPAEAPRGW